ncbi:MAG: hypothetical protein QGH11_12390, partial [Pirellulaceae bacterium]|nr:hypothetical protein [Pirellulaceae bacterium]
MSFPSEGLAVRTTLSPKTYLFIIEAAWEDAGHDAPVYSTSISRAAVRLLGRVEDASAQDLPPHWS